MFAHHHCLAPPHSASKADSEAAFRNTKPRHAGRAASECDGDVRRQQDGLDGGRFRSASLTPARPALPGVCEESRRQGLLRPLRGTLVVQPAYGSAAGKEVELSVYGKPDLRGGARSRRYFSSLATAR